MLAKKDVLNWAKAFGESEIESFISDGSVPAICVNCGAEDDMELCQTHGYCHECNTTRMVSVLIVLGFI